MRPLTEMSSETAAAIRVVFTDIDDTLTTDGRLPAKAYAALERLHDAGLAVAPVTGRPAGWCDMVARLWPVDGVVGENGAFYFAYDRAMRRLRRVYAASEAERLSNRRRLNVVLERVLSEIPGAAAAADQPYREADLAIDFCEDVPRLSPQAVTRIQEIFSEHGATSRVSSIHVNGWFGDHDKLSMTRRFAAEVLDVDIDSERERITFCGDSPNDEPMFRHFPNACGVANVRRFAGCIEAQPAFVASSSGAAGFVEMACAILRARQAADPVTIAETTRR